MIEETTESLLSEATAVSDTTTVITVQEQVARTANFFEKGLDKLKDAIPSMVIALLIFLFGVIAAKIIIRIIRRAMKKSNIDNAAKNFLVSFIKVILYINVVIMALSALKVPMSSIIAIFGAAGLAVSLALQNCLSNLAGGFIILFSKPFSAGDILEIDGSVGKVDTISILYTKIVTFDNKTVFIPNGKVSEGKIINYTESPTRRVDLRFEISYAADYQKARELILAAAAADKLILKSPEPIVRMTSHSENSVSIDALVWVNNNDYFDARYDLLESVKSSFDENGIEIPFNQLDIHIKDK